MMKFHIDRKSISYRMTTLVIALIIGQTMLLLGTIIAVGILSDAKENAYETLSMKVSNRKDYIQSEMKNRWTNFTPYMAPLSELLPRKADVGYENLNEFWYEIAPSLVSMLRTTLSTGVFIILDDGSGDQKGYSSLYFRDYDPLLNDSSNKDLYLVAGPWDISQSMNIPMDQYWHYDIWLSDANREFFDKPYESDFMQLTSEYLGYWSKPFKLSENDITVMTYTIPIYNKYNERCGVIGIEVAINHLSKFLPATDLQPQDSLGYLIGYSGSHEAPVSPVVTLGALQKRIINEDEAFDWTPTDSDQSIYLLNNHKSKTDIYAAVEKIGFYNYNTPFNDESWYLIGLMQEDDLMIFVDKIQNTILTSLITSILIGLIGGYIFSRRITRPIISLAKRVSISGSENAIDLGRLGLTELDHLAASMEVANKNLIASTSRLSTIVDLLDVKIGAFEIDMQTKHVMTTDKLQSILSIEDQKILTDSTLFLRKIEQIMLTPEPDEEEVYSVSHKWIRLKLSKEQDVLLGVAIDVTDEINEKHIIKSDRDLDALTEIYNRKAFQRVVENIYSHETLKIAALIMLDLDHLKWINDQYGHKCGDDYIKATAGHLGIFSEKGHIIGRRSGDEFLVFLYGFEEKEAITDMVQSFYENLESNPLTLPDGTSRKIMISSGLTWCPTDALNYEQLLQHADEALYMAKSKKKGNLVVYSIET